MRFMDVLCCLTITTVQFRIRGLDYVADPDETREESVSSTVSVRSCSAPQRGHS